MSSVSSIIERNYPFPAAGRTWIVPEYHLSRSRDGTLGVTMEEMRRIHLAVATALCAVPGSLTTEEVEFLCDVANVDLVRRVDAIDLNLSAVLQWVRAGRSNQIKRWFLHTLFGDEACSSAELRDLDDAAALPYIAAQLVRLHVVSEITALPPDPPARTSASSPA